MTVKGIPSLRTYRTRRSLSRSATIAPAAMADAPGSGTTYAIWPGRGPPRSYCSGVTKHVPEGAGGGVVAEDAAGVRAVDVKEAVAAESPAEVRPHDVDRLPAQRLGRGDRAVAGDDHPVAVHHDRLLLAEPLQRRLDLLRVPLLRRAEAVDVQPPEAVGGGAGEDLPLDAPQAGDILGPPPGVADSLRDIHVHNCSWTGAPKSSDHNLRQG